MKVVLISSYSHPLALGLRYLSAYLKSAGHDVEMIFMSGRRETAKPKFPPAALDAMIERCRRADLVGVSLMTNSFFRACFLTETLSQADVKAPIVWGGHHPTIATNECVGVADVVCVGEGERPMLEFVEQLEAGRDPTGVGGLCFRANGWFGNPREIRNPIRTLVEDLDDYPFPDYELDTHWMADEKGLVRPDDDNLRGILDCYRMETTRGCPSQCTFCNNTTWLSLYKGKGRWVRMRSLDSIMAEFDQVLACFPQITGVNIIDDLFFVRSDEQMEAFAEAYRERVNLPLEMDAFPTTITERKLAALSKLPIRLVSMGIQSGSEDTLQSIYRRRTPLPRIVDAMRLLRRYKIPAEYHYLIANPLEPDANVIETMRFIATHHRGPVRLRTFPLALFPGTPLADRAREAGLIGERHEPAYTFTYDGHRQKLELDDLSIWVILVLHLRNAGVPRWLVHRLIDVVTNPFLRRHLGRRVFVPTALAAFVVTRKLYKILIHEPIVRPCQSLQRWRRRRRTASTAGAGCTAPGPATPRRWSTPISRKLANRRPDSTPHVQAS